MIDYLMNLQRHLLLLLTIFPLFSPSYVAAQDSFFNKGFSLEEQKDFKNQSKHLKQLSKAIKALRMMSLFQSFQEGDCEEYLKIEAKAKQGSSEDQYIMADLYHLGLCVNKNNKESFLWIQKSAVQSHMMAMRDLAIYYKLGRGTEQNFQMSVHWFEKAALAGESVSQKQLGNMYVVDHVNNNEAR